MAHVCSFDTHGYSEYVTVEEALKRLYPNAKQFLRCKLPYVRCTCDLINQKVKAVVLEDNCVYPPYPITVIRHRLELYYLGEDKAEVWIYNCGCGKLYYNYEDETKVRIRI